jgi:hypothetical protein
LRARRQENIKEAIGMVELVPDSASFARSSGALYAHEPVCGLDRLLSRGIDLDRAARPAEAVKRR